MIDDPAQGGSAPGSWARFLAQRDGTRFITQPGEDGIERQLPDDRADEAGVGCVHTHSDIAAEQHNHD